MDPRLDISAKGAEPPAPGAGERLILSRDSYYRPTRARKLRTEAARHQVWLRILEWPVPPRPAVACVLGTFFGMLLLGALAIPLLEGAGLLAAAAAVAAVSS